MSSFIIFYIQLTIAFQAVCLFIPIRLKEKFKLIFRFTSIAIVLTATFFFIKNFNSLDGFSIFLFVALSAMNIILNYHNKFTITK